MLARPLLSLPPHTPSLSPFSSHRDQTQSGEVWEEETERRSRTVVAQLSQCIRARTGELQERSRTVTVLHFLPHELVFIDQWETTTTVNVSYCKVCSLIGIQHQEWHRTKKKTGDNNTEERREGKDTKKGLEHFTVRRGSEWLEFTCSSIKLYCGHMASINLMRKKAEGKQNDFYNCVHIHQQTAGRLQELRSSRQETGSGRKYRQRTEQNNSQHIKS